MGLFDKKFCDFCGNKIGLLGNKKLEDGNMCRDCASKLSPWFSERRHSTKAEIGAQLQYREENRAAVAAFCPTKSIGRTCKLILDERARKFMVTSASDPAKENPDVLDFSQVRGCDLNIDENRSELKHTDSEGKSVSYNPPRYEYSYNFHVKIYVDHPFFDEIGYSLSNGYFKVGERPMNAAGGAWRMNRAGFGNRRENDYYEYLSMGEEIREAVERMRSQAGVEPRERTAYADNMGAPARVSEPSGLVVCPWCGSKTVPDEKGCCSFCGGSVNA